MKLESIYTNGFIQIETSKRVAFYSVENGSAYFDEGEDVSGKFKIEQSVIAFDVFGSLYRKYAVPTVQPKIKQ